jgi:hypothetical protein
LTLSSRNSHRYYTTRYPSYQINEREYLVCCGTEVLSSAKPRQKQARAALTRVSLELQRPSQGHICDWELRALTGRRGQHGSHGLGSTHYRRTISVYSSTFLSDVPALVLNVHSPAQFSPHLCHPIVRRSNGRFAYSILRFTTSRVWCGTSLSRTLVLTNHFQLPVERPVCRTAECLCV